MERDLGVVSGLELLDLFSMDGGVLKRALIYPVRLHQLRLVVLDGHSGLVNLDVLAYEGTLCWKG